MEKQYNKPLVLSILYVLLFMIAFVSGLQNPFGVIVKDQFGVSNAMAQIGNLANFIAYALMGYPAGKILARYGYKFTSLIAVAIGFAGVSVQLLSGVSANYYVLVAGAFVTGFSMCLLNTLVNPMLNIIGGGGKSGNRLLQYGGSFYTIGGMAVPYVMGLLIADGAEISAAFPVFYFSLAVFLVSFIVIKMTVFPEPESDYTAGKARKGYDSKDKYSCLSFRHFVLGALAVFLYMGVEVGIANTTNIYLTNEAGFQADAAGVIISIYWLFMVIGRISGGVAGGRFTSRQMLLFVSAVSLALVAAFIFIPEDVMLPVSVGRISGIPLNVSMLLLCGLCVAVMWGSIFNLAIEGLGKYTSAASGVFMIMVCGGGVVPAVQGVISDRFGCVPSFWLIALCLVYIVYYAIQGSRNVNRDIPVD